MGITGFLVFKEPAYHYYIPVTFTRELLPLIEIEIEGEKYEVAVATLSSGVAGLPPDQLAKIKNKQETAANCYKNLQGIVGTRRAYIVPQLTVGQDVIHNVSVAECPAGDIGYINMAVLKKNLLFNFGGDVIIVSNDKKKLRDLGFNLANMLQTTLSIKKCVPVDVETDFGLQKFIVVSCAPHNMINQRWTEQESVVLQKLAINGHNFGPCTLTSSEIRTNRVVDGILGMKFLIHHPIYLDYQNDKVYFAYRFCS